MRCADRAKGCSVVHVDNSDFVGTHDTSNVFLKKQGQQTVVVTSEEAFVQQLQSVLHSTKLHLFELQFIGFQPMVKVYIPDCVNLQQT